jgi:class 3 adenylate cyclase/TolB-like protein/tetratricopeptide (TPR) repeat protein
MERRLSAILAADVAGYCRHTERNEEASTTTLSAYRVVVEDSIAAHKGHVFTRAGDGVVAEFPSVVEAVRCAIEIQNEIGMRNASLPESDRMQFRIGVNLGDVISEDNNCYGTGVNVAARLEQLAEPGGICISQTVYDQVRQIVEVPFQDIGEHRLKNITDPVRVYRVLPAPLPWYKRLLSQSKTRLRRPEFAALISLLILAVAGGASFSLREPAVLWNTLLGEAFKGNAIVVRPFEDKGDSSEQQTFSSGLTNDIMAGLSRTLSVFEYQGKAHDIRDIGREFKARYVLEGSVSPSGGDLFYIRPKLTDAQSGKTVWTQRFDRNMAERSDVDDEIACQIVAKIAGGYGVIESSEAKSAAGKGPAELQADQRVSQAREKMQYEWKPELFAEAGNLLCLAFKDDPNSVPVKRELAFHHLMSVVMGFAYVQCDPDAPKSVEFEDVAKDAKEAALEIINREPDDGRARMLAATAYFFIPELDLFEKEAEQAIKDAPCDPQVLAILGALLGNHGNWPRGVMLVERANELNPRAAEGWYQSTMYLNYYLQDHDYERALAKIRESPDFQKGTIYAYYDYLAICGKLVGDDTKCTDPSPEEAWRKILENVSSTTIKTFEDWYRGWNFKDSDIEQLLAGIRESGVGVPEVQPVATEEHHTEAGAER